MQAMFSLGPFCIAARRHPWSAWAESTRSTAQCLRVAPMISKAEQCWHMGCSSTSTSSQRFSHACSIGNLLCWEKQMQFLLLPYGPLSLYAIQKQAYARGCSHSSSEQLLSLLCSGAPWQCSKEVRAGSSQQSLMAAGAPVAAHGASGGGSGMRAAGKSLPRSDFPLSATCRQSSGGEQPLTEQAFALLAQWEE